MVWLGDETLIRRQIRQVRTWGAEPIILTTNEILIAHLEKCDPPSQYYEPPYHHWLSETMLWSEPLWGKRVLFLLGDVLFSRQAIDHILNCQAPLAVFGDNAETFAFSFSDKKRGRGILERVTKLAQKGVGYGKLWNIYRLLEGLPIDEHIIQEPGIFHRIDDWTTDIDTSEKYRWVQKNLLELQVVDDRAK